MLSAYRHGKSLSALGAFFVFVVSLGVLRPAWFDVLVNPLELSLLSYVFLYVSKCLSLACIDGVVGHVVERRYASKPLPYRLNTGAVGLERLEWIDYLYLGINSLIEWIFTAHVIRLVLENPNLAYRPRDLTFFNTLPALYLIFALDDFFYAPAHKLMHQPFVYAYVHKHHHRQNLPKRGYLDAGNEHPIEQVLGLSCLWLTLIIVSRLVGVHALTIVAHFLAYAILALLNHTNFDVNFHFAGFHYSVKNHEMHHRYPQANLAQYFMLWDKLLGTYKPYQDGAPKLSTTGDAPIIHADTTTTTANNTIKKKLS